MSLTFRCADGSEGSFEINRRELEHLLGNSPDPLVPPANPSTINMQIAEEVIERYLEAHDQDQSEILDVSIFVSDGPLGRVMSQATAMPTKTEADDVLDSTVRRVSGCRSILRLANFVLPRSVREDALDEWMDELLSAAEEDLSFRRRAISILCRSLPALALRARRPVRARRGEG